MNANEKIYVAGFWCESTETSWETGEDPTRRGAAWGNKDIGFDKDRPFDTVGQALAAVCESNSFKYVPKSWIDFGKDYGEEYGRFDGDVLVDDENVEASPDEIEKWKEGEKRLWNCHILVRLEIRSVRPFGPDDEVEMSGENRGCADV